MYSLRGNKPSLSIISYILAGQITRRVAPSVAPSTGCSIIILSLFFVIDATLFTNTTFSNKKKRKSPQFCVRSLRQDIVDDMYRFKSTPTWVVCRQHDNAHGKKRRKSSVLHQVRHQISADFDACNDVFDIIHYRTDAIRTYSKCSSSALFN